MYVDPWVFLALVLVGVYGVERLFADLVRFIDRRTRSKSDKPTIITPRQR